MKFEHLPKFVQEKLGPTWTREKLVKLYLKCPHKVQYLLARYGIRLVVNKKKAEMMEFMRH